MRCSPYPWGPLLFYCLTSLTGYGARDGVWGGGWVWLTEAEGLKNRERQKNRESVAYLLIAVPSFPSDPKLIFCWFQTPVLAFCSLNPLLTRIAWKICRSKSLRLFKLTICQKQHFEKSKHSSIRDVDSLILCLFAGFKTN